MDRICGLSIMDWTLIHYTHSANPIHPTVIIRGGDTKYYSHRGTPT
ncbi:unnamed protein product [Staurois parvus]|uniref:Uncharacterized protein n=1 Tax=Staurois parvus TaxID=386267 RepID=A0ABN9GN99_9NEOB|nr:unnamed protein product [Staurois parvus]